MIREKPKRIIKCPGRFPEIRIQLAEAIDLLSSDDKNFKVSEIGQLEEIIGLVGDLQKVELPQLTQDPYFLSRTDVIRRDPFIKEYLPLSIIPLISRDVDVSTELKDEYLRGIFRAPESEIDFMRNFHKGATNLGDKVGLNLQKTFVLCKDGDSVKHLGGYRIDGDFGIGGTTESFVVADAPYMIYLVKNKDQKDPESEDVISLGIGFWYNGAGRILVAQMQQPRGAIIPAGCHTGVIGLTIASKLAQIMGLREVATYSAENHPMFVQYPIRKQRADLMGQFREIFDKSAITLNFSGTHNDYYYLDLLDSRNNRIHGKQFVRRKESGYNH